jgi:hypothetical protein
MQTEERLKEIWFIRKILGDELFTLIDTKNKEYKLYNNVFDEWFCTIEIKEDEFHMYLGVFQGTKTVGLGDPQLIEKVRDIVGKAFYKSEHLNEDKKKE